MKTSKIRCLACSPRQCHTCGRDALLRMPPFRSWPKLRNPPSLTASGPRECSTSTTPPAKICSTIFARKRAVHEIHEDKMNEQSRYVLFSELQNRNILFMWCDVAASFRECLPEKVETSALARLLRQQISSLWRRGLIFANSKLGGPLHGLTDL